MPLGGFNNGGTGAASILGPTRILLVDWPGASQSELVIGGLRITNCDPDNPIAGPVSSYFGGIRCMAHESVTIA